MKNEISFDYSTNAELRDLFAGKEIGESCELKIRFQLNEKDDKGAKGTVEEVVAEAYDDHEEREVKPDMDKPVMVVMVAGSGETKSKGGGY